MKPALAYLWLLCSAFLWASGIAAAQFVRYQTDAGPVPGKLNVHLVPHSHDDVGWLKTVDQYFTGSNQSIQTASVRSILDSLVDALLKDPNRKFIYVEQAFFQRWWREQSPERQKTVQTLVSNGQLEFINGGWCMHDEATVHYLDMIDQTTLGHRFLKQQFNVVPTVGWQIDPFGHSAVQAYLLGAELGFSSLFFARIDYQDYDQRKKLKNLEFIWRPSKTLGASSQIFTGVLFNGYGPPPYFDWDVYSDDPLIQDDPLLFDYVVDPIVETFVNYAKSQSAYYQGNDIMLTMGTDFQYTYSESWFRQMDRLIHYVNQDGRVNTFYSTPSIYTASKAAANVTWTVKTDDFFPYADCPSCFWTGYFTSRAALKGYVRVSSALLQAGRQLEYITGKRVQGNKTDSLEEALGILQHHDAVSGTEKQHVAFDYARRLAIGEAEARKVVTANLQLLATSSTSFAQCPGLNVSYCPSSETAYGTGQSVVVVVYNPLGWSRTEHIRIPVVHTAIYVEDSTGNPVTFQLVPVDILTRRLRHFYVLADYGFNVSTRGELYWLVFQATVPPLGYNTYTISNSSADVVVEPPTTSSNHLGTLGDLEVQTDSVKATFSGTTGLLKTLSNLVQNVTVAVEQAYDYYVSYDGTNSQDSGAYIFRPANNTPVDGSVSTQVPWVLFNGPLVVEVQQEFSPWIHQVVRLYKGQDHAEVEFTVGPIPTDDGVGKEVVTRLSSDLQSNGTFYTDSNGRDFLKRVRDYRPSWNYTVTEPVAGNYYPLNLGIYLTDGTKDLSVLVDRAQGGGSISDGQLEIMLHRRLIADDSRGVGEALDEQVCTSESCEALTVRGKYYVNVSPSSKAAQWRRNLGQRVVSPVQLAFTVQSGQAWKSSFKANFSMMAPGYELPPNVAVITLQELDNGEVLLRLAHLYEVNEDVTYSKLASVNLKQVFAQKRIVNATEVSLSANQNKVDLKLQLWKVISEGASADLLKGGSFDLAEGVVELGPMEIRSFILQIE